MSATYIDLSVPITPDMPVYPGDPAVVIEQVGTIDPDGYTDHRLSMGNHAGTHIDAPLHMVDGGKTLDQFPVERFIGSGHLIEVTEEGFDLQALKKADIQAGDIVLFKTGMSKHFKDPVYFHEYPAMSEEVANYLVECRVSMVGVDTGSVDNKADFPIHIILLGGDVLIIENLTNLEKLEGKDFTVYAFPLNLTIDASPARVLAHIA